MTGDGGATYRKAGVDIDAGAHAVDLMRDAARSTFRPGVLTDIGGFGGLFEPALGRYAEPVLVSAADGVGTKLEVARLMARHDTVGIDLVAMCANDILCSGAEPLFFLDYIACGKLVPERIAAIVEGVAEGCRRAGCALLGGETAEHPGLMGADDYDLAGFVVGIVEKSRVIDGRDIQAGDVLLGLGSSGVHANGFSLIRSVLVKGRKEALEELEPTLGAPLGQVLLAPTRIYVGPVLDLIKHFNVRAMAHITGGGITENLARILPEGLEALVHRGSWRRLPIFDLLAERGRIAEDEMYRTFNMGLGYVLVVPPGQSDDVAAFLAQAGERVSEIGSIRTGDGGVVYA